MQPRGSLPKLYRSRGHPVSRLVGRLGVGLISERVEVVVSAFSTIRCSGGHRVVRLVERITVISK